MPKRTKSANLAHAQKPVLNAERYNRLLRDVQALLQRATSKEEGQRVVAHWSLGRRIARERLQSEAGYHNSVLRDLAKANGIALRTLQYAVKFHALYEVCPKSSLNLGHYRVLIDSTTAARRAHYEALAIKEGLSATALRQRILHDQHERAGNATWLQRPTERDYTYRAVVEQVIDGDTLDLRIDTGFHIHTSGRFRLSGIDCPELNRSGDSRIARDAAVAARDFVYTQLLTANTIVVQTITSDTHGRYLAHLFYTPDKTSIRTCFHEGHHLNEELLKEGHAQLAV
jgi:micrococcal nuclease